MGFKTGLVVGLGVGYVLGAKAGRERYEELRATWHQLMGNPTVQRTLDRAGEAAQSGARRGLQAVQEGVEAASDSVQKRRGGGRTGSS